MHHLKTPLTVKSNISLKGIRFAFILMSRKLCMIRFCISLRPYWRFSIDDHYPSQKTWTIVDFDCTTNGNGNVLGRTFYSYFLLKGIIHTQNDYLYINESPCVTFLNKPLCVLHASTHYKESNSKDPSWLMRLHRASPKLHQIIHLITCECLRYLDSIYFSSWRQFSVFRFSLWMQALQIEYSSTLQSNTWWVFVIQTIYIFEGQGIPLN